MNEGKRLFGLQMIFMLIIAVAINVIIFLNIQTKGKDIPTFQKNMKEYHSLLQQFNLSDMNIDEMIEENDKRMHQIKAGVLEGDYDVAAVFQKKLEHVRDYPVLMEEIQKNAENLIQFSIFADVDSFSYHNIIKTKQDFEKFQEIEINIENDFAAEALTDYFIPFCISLFVMLVFIYKIYRERECGVWELIYASSRGRGRLAWKRIILFTIASILIVASIYGSTIIASYMLYGGWGSLSSNVQQLMQYSRCVFPVSIGSFFIINGIFGWLVLWTISIIIWSLFTFIKKRSVALGIVCTFIGAEAILFTTIASQSKYVYLKIINIISFMNIGKLLRQYKNWGTADIVISTGTLILTVICFLGILGIGAVTLGICRQHPCRSPVLYIDWVEKLISRLKKRRQQFLAFLNVGFLELHKLLFSAKGIIFIFTAVIISLYFCQSTKMNFTQGMKHRDEIYLQMGGQDYSQLKEYIEETTANYRDAQEQFMQARSDLSDGLITYEQFYSFSAMMQSAKEQYTFALEFIEKDAYIKELEEQGLSAYMISDRGYEEIFGKYSTKRELILMLVMMVGITLLINEGMAMEYISGMRNILSSAVNGRTYMVVRKTAACLLMAFLFFALIYGIDYVFLYHYYGMPYLDAPIVSLTFMKDCGLEMTIKTFLLLSIFSKLGTAIMVVGTSLAASVFIGKTGQKNLAMVITAALIVYVIFYLKLTYNVQFILGMAGAAAGFGFMVYTGILWGKSS